MAGAKEAYSLQGIFSSAYLQSWQELAISVPLETLTFGWKNLRLLQYKLEARDFEHCIGFPDAADFSASIFLMPGGSEAQIFESRLSVHREERTTCCLETNNCNALILCTSDLVRFSEKKKASDNSPNTERRQKHHGWRFFQRPVRSLENTMTVYILTRDKGSGGTEPEIWVKPSLLWAYVICDQAFHSKSGVEQARCCTYSLREWTNRRISIFLYPVWNTILFGSVVAFECIFSTKWNILQLKSGLDSLATKF